MASKKKTTPGLYANIHAKQERIAHGSGEKMRKAGDAEAPKAKNFEQAEKTAKPKKPSSTRSSKK